MSPASPWAIRTSNTLELRTSVVHRKRNILKTLWPGFTCTVVLWYVILINDIETDQNRKNIGYVRDAILVLGFFLWGSIGSTIFMFIF